MASWQLICSFTLGSKKKSSPKVHPASAKELTLSQPVLADENLSVVAKNYDQ
jgi:hypothetical protein